MSNRNSLFSLILRDDLVNPPFPVNWSRARCVQEDPEECREQSQGRHYPSLFTVACFISLGQHIRPLYHLRLLDFFSLWAFQRFKYESAILIMLDTSDLCLLDSWVNNCRIISSMSRAVAQTMYVGMDASIECVSSNASGSVQAAERAETDVYNR